MKTIARCFTAGIFMLTLCRGALPLKAADEIVLHEAKRQLVAKAEAGLKSAAASHGGAVALLSIVGDDDRYVEGLLKAAATRAGITFVEGTGQPLFETLLAQASQNLRDKQFLDPATIAEMGKLVSAKTLLYGMLTVNSSADVVYAELSLHMVEVTTGRHVWGDVFTERHYLGDNVRGIVDLIPEIRQLFDEVAAEAGKSMAEATALYKAASVLVVPLAGDLDGYGTGHLVSALSKTSAAPVDLGVKTLSQARMLAESMDADKKPDALLIGAVRDIARRIESKDGKGETWRYDVEIEARIIDMDSNRVLWSDTIGKSLLVAYAEPSVPDRLMIWLNEKPVRYVYLIGGALAVLFVLAVLSKLARAMTRAR